MFVGLALLVLFIVSASQGVIYLGLLELAAIIGIGVLISRVRTELQPHNKALQRELALEASEKERTRRVQPPNERQYDEWISAISDDIYKNAPTRLRLHEHPDHRAWRKAINSGLYPPQPEPEEFGASLCLEGRMISSAEAKENPPQLEKITRDCLRIKHYSVYEFTALFITEDYVAVYTSIINLRDPTRDREEFEYFYYPHLSHLSLNVSTTWQDIGTQPPKQIALQESCLALILDSGRRIERNVLTLHIGNQSITSIANTGIANIHEKLTKALIDHERSMTRSIQEANSLE